MIFIKYILIFYFSNFLYSAYLFFPENMSLSSAGGISYNDFRSLNPSVIASHEGLSVQLLGSSYGIGNNFLSVSNYNDINGVNLHDPTASNYFPKSDFYALFSDGIKLNSQMAISLPGSNIIYNNISFSSRTYFMFDMTLPKSIIQLPLYGNQINESYDLGINSSIHIFSEHSFGYSKQLSNISIGGRVKYLQGLAYGEFVNISENSSYFETDSTGFLGKAEYLINQGIGGSGFSFDFGLFNHKPINGWNFGLSIINIFGSIKWDNNNFTHNFLRDPIISRLPLRYNEKQYLSINLDTLNAMNMISTPLDEIYKVENFSVIEFSSYEDIPFDFISDDGNIRIISSNEENDIDTLDTEKYGKLKLIITADSSYVIESQNIASNELEEFNLNSVSQKTTYPSYFNISTKKALEDDITVCLGLTAGFSNSLRNSRKWKVSSGLLFNRFKNVPITLGVSFGGSEKVSSGFSIGYERGPISINYGMLVRNAIFFQSMKGCDFSISLIFKTNKI